MRKPATIATGLGLFLLLTACPGSYASFRAGTASDGNVTFNSTRFYVSAPKDDPDRVQPSPVYSRRFTLWSGDEIIWQIERESCSGWDQGPSQIVYGVTPPCYREVVPPRPLTKGRAYFMDGMHMVQGKKLYEAHTEGDTFIYDDPIQSISWRGYRNRTRQYRAPKD
ncbi:hypothetical protein P1X14_21345 [Sphingomonas sp. AOB5]|uniref:hypothetical protein n=1 Tax=Sphingomonas sp. AOB5 TaxID=3034017 RepID=UPI0023F64691|nr:hypothetical protein [Sphingomonas sp. AOB5]MDF7777815.1 hypothetical protein [Sphingomonas sp. AOB5]